MPRRGWRPPSRWSLRARVTFLVTAIFVGFIIAGWVAYYFILHAIVFKNLRHDGEKAVAEISAAVRAPGPDELRTRQLGFSLIQIVDDRGRVVAANTQAAGLPPLTARRPARYAGTVAKTVDVGGYDSSVYVVGGWAHTPDGWRIVYTGLPVPVLGIVLRVMMWEAIFAVPLTGLVVGWAIWHAVFRAVRPVQRMERELAAITGGAAEQRLTVPTTGDEVAHLAESINVTLQRLQRVLERQRGFVADVSHELRSPLTGLQAQLEVALQSPEDEDWPAVARGALGEADRLQRLVADLLIMAKLDAGVPLEREAIDLGAFAGDESVRHRRRVPVDVDAEPGVLVWGSKHALMRVLTNLLDNAERHAAGRIEVRVRSSGGDAVLTVRDDGAGIAPEDREKVFRRFQRLAESRRRDKGGSGLGLPISRDIANAHGGSLIATGDGLPSAAGAGQGACLKLRLPLSDSGTRRTS
ncbi:sensor histidine kinase [Actinomadura atramentaria]|uniref:sensor histidine kinase n=1 Tax=Actinomadura atramentaria TaxID=1990 RepID=UPI00037024BA|nr:HAMP domain-containing sensor histidine kinase [Actinomadura atramentaria]